MRTTLLVIVIAVSAACETPEIPITGPTEVVIATEHFRGGLQVGGVRFYSFRVQEGGTVTVTLASITTPPFGFPVSASLRLGLGIPQGTGCALSKQVTAAASLNAQLTELATPGIYCVEIADIGELREPITFAARFTHP